MKDVIAALRNPGVAKETATDEVSLYPEMSDDGRTVTGISASSTVTPPSASR